MIHNYSPIVTSILSGDWDKYKAEPFSIGFANHGDPTLFVGDYNQITSKRFATEVDFFRGVVIDSTTNKILCMPYTRMYNVQEDHKSFMSNSDSALYILEEKVDGSMIKVYKNTKGIWTIATRSTSEANNEIWTDDLLIVGEKTTYKQLFLNTMKMTDSQFQEYCTRLNDKFMMTRMIANKPDPVAPTILFELCTKLNKVVIDYPTDRVYFHGFSYLENNQPVVVKPHFISLSTMVAPAIPVPVIADIKYTHNSLEDFLKDIDTLLLKHSKNTLIEGCIIQKTCNGTVDYFKYKTNQYVIAHKLRGQSGSLNLADASEMYLENEHHEFLAYYPEYQFVFDNIDAVVQDMNIEIDSIFVKWNELKNDFSKTEKQIRKEFFEMVQGHKYFHCIMNKYSHPETTPLDWLNKITTNSRSGFFETQKVKEKK